MGLKFKRETLFKALEWVSKKRKSYSFNSDIWDFRWHFRKNAKELIRSLAENRYRFDAMIKYVFPDKTLHLWNAQDALVIKMISLTLDSRFDDPIFSSCFHLKGKGGTKGAVKEIIDKQSEYSFVFKSDIRAFYESIDHQVMKSLLSALFCPEWVNLINQTIERSVYYEGVWRSIKQGIPRGSALSPKLAAIALLPLDLAMQNNPHVFYVRYMDDFVILAKTRNHLRKAIKQTYAILEKLKLELSKKKTNICRLDKGFDFLGYHIERDRCLISKKTLIGAQIKMLDLYEKHGRDSSAVQAYLKRFTTWATHAEKLSASG